MKKIIRTSTVAGSLNVLLRGQLRFLNNYFEIVAISGADDRLKELESREGVRVIGISMCRKISICRDIISLWKLYKTFKKEKPDIVHSITPKAGLLSMLAAKIAGVKIRVHTFTGLVFPTRTGTTRKVLIKMDQLLCWAATNIYPEGLGVKQDLIDFKITNKPLKVLGNGNVNGVDLSYFDAECVLNEDRKALLEQLKIEPTDFVYIYVGRIVKDKGINELLNAFTKMECLTGGNQGDTKKRGNCKLLLVGLLDFSEDPITEEAQEIIRDNPNILTVGFRKDVRPYFAIAHALVFPSYREGFPNVVLQAGAMGLPSIVSDISGCNEIIIDGVNGIIIPVKNEEKLLEAMIKLKTDSLYYHELQKNTRQMIVSRYNQDYVWEELLKEYHMLLS